MNFSSKSTINVIRMINLHWKKMAGKLTT